MPIRIIFLLSLSFSVGAPGVQENLRTLVRQHGHIAKAILNEYSPASFADLVKESDLVARVRVVKHRAALSSDETTVSTTYAAQLVEVLHSRGKEPATGGNIEVVRPGGTVVLDGHTVEVYEQDFPAFELGHEYVLFLREERTRSYRVAHGAQGAFGIDNNLVDQMSRNNGAIKQTMRQFPLSRLRAEVRGAAAGKE